MSSTIEELLEAINSTRSTSRELLHAISRLEEEFGKVVLTTEDEPGTSGRTAKNAWWDAQGKPRSSVALSLISLIHRLHLRCQLDTSSKSADESELICSQLISSFTILQGLCLKDEESRRICGRKSSLELILDVVGAQYWDSNVLSNAPAHAIDLLICITISSPPASRLIEGLQGEEVVRVLMERHTIGKNAATEGKGSTKRAVTLDAVQDNPLATKCAEFLLFFEYGREEGEKNLRGNNDVLLGTSLQRAAHSQTKTASHSHHYNPEERVSQREFTARDRSSSPIKSRSNREEFRARREERIKVVRSRPIQTSSTSQESPRSATTEIKHFKSSLTPFTKSASASPFKPPSRGRSRERSPFGILQASTAGFPSQPSPTDMLSSTHSSPLKAIMGPSPAVQRAHARSVSPIKKTTSMRRRL